MHPSVSRKYLFSPGGLNWDISTVPPMLRYYYGAHHSDIRKRVQGEHLKRDSDIHTGYLFWRGAKFLGRQLEAQPGRL